ncbi:hypothetical protein HO133_009874 [Letharia lupina]|uniref:DUF7702 domain-containing protein n=1 Tax=Letharia lupina TaxID=560253 RepID=A0A8H6CLT5_9LECA|nr:uncharacterized protein HO133_009874 [Letharia lupina]KAF6225872.1 hypothetical protein HO133_009874 [Letharia lupina]
MASAAPLVGIDSIKKTSTFPLSAIHFRTIQLLITIGLILSIAGGSNSISSGDNFKVQSTSKVGIILYILAYVALTLISLLTGFKLSQAASGEKRLLLAVILALPFILVRLVYSTLAALTHFQEFNLLTGSVAIFAIMAVAMEFAVVLIYLVTGWTTNVVPASQRGPIMSRPWKGNSHGAIFHPGGRQGRRQGPIHGLVNAAVAAAQQQTAQQSGEVGRSGMR